MISTNFRKKRTEKQSAKKLYLIPTKANKRAEECLKQKNKNIIPISFFVNGYALRCDDYYS
jgi:hypothetical protein